MQAGAGSVRKWVCRWVGLAVEQRMLARVTGCWVVEAQAIWKIALRVGAEGDELDFAEAAVFGGAGAQGQQGQAVVDALAGQ